MVLLGIIFSPLIMAIIAGLLILYAKVSALPKPGIDRLVAHSVAYAAAGAAASFVLLSVWMFWYEQSAGYSVGSATGTWLIFHGPLSIALGQLVALILWWREKRS